MRSKVTINDRGVITIPARMREALGIRPNDEFIIEDTENGLFLRLAFEGAIETYSEDRITELVSDERAIDQILPPYSGEA